MFKRVSLVAATASLMVAAGAAAQFDASNVELRAWIDLSTFGSNSGNDCWGYVSPQNREYALMGLNNKVAFVEITDPDNPVWFASIAHNASLWGDIKVYQDHAYAVTEAGSGIQVISLANIDNHQVTLVRTLAAPSSNHNIALDPVSGYLYTCGSTGGSATTTIWDLANPGNPVQVGQWTGAYEHDAQIVTYTSGPYAGKQILFGASEGRGLDIIDVTNKSSVQLLSRTPYPGVSYAHQAWTEDLVHLYLDDELDSTPRTTVFDITDLSNPVFKGDFTSGLGATDHNLYVHEGFVYCANYKSGLRIFDTNVDPLNPPQVGYFDTYPGADNSGFQGAWSVYPFFPSGIVIISDIDRGLFIVDPAAAREGALGFEYPEGRPEFVSPAGGTTMRVQVTTLSGNAQPQPGTGILHVDRGSGFESFPMNDLGNNLYEAVFPSSSCGTTVRYYISAETTTARVHTDPVSAPNSSYSALSAGGVIVSFTDDFETDKGWTVENISLTAGAWQRGVPIGGGTRGDPLTDADGSGRCYVTGNAAGDSDVDGGPTRLVSPAFDLSSQPEAAIEYFRWFTNDDGDDRFDVHLSNNNGSTWTLVESSLASGQSAWEQKRFRVSDFLAPTQQMRIRFSATDNPNNSVTEAGLDAFRVQTIVCGGTTLTGFSVTFGTLISGGLAQLLDSDDQVVRVRSSFGFTSAEPNVAEVQCDFETTQASPAALDITIESRLNHSNGTARVRLRNYANNGVFNTVHQYPLGTTETIEEVTGIPAANYVQQGTGAITLRLRQSVVLVFSSAGFDGFIDQVKIAAQ